jgi:hypothetical protein
MTPLLLVALLGLGTVAAEEPLMFPGDPLTTPVGEPFNAVVNIDAEPAGKRFQGVWLVRDDGEKWLIDYRARPHWKPFEGVAVQVSGERYHPDGQSIGAVHFRVHTMAVVEPTMAHDLATIGPEQTLTGRFAIAKGEPGSKMGGSTWTVFDTDTRQFMLANHSESFKGEGTVTARQVTLSPFVAHMTGPRIWVIAFLPKPDSEQSTPTGE